MVEETKQVAEAVGILGPLGVDGKIFVAQLVNVSIVIFVMWKWVYKPLLKVMDDRASKIERGLADATDAAAAKARAEAEKEQVVLEARLKAKSILEEALAVAQADGQAFLGRTRQETAKIVAAGREQLAAEKERLAAEVKAEIGGLLADAVEKIARQKLDAGRDAELIRDSLTAVERL